MVKTRFAPSPTGYMHIAAPARRCFPGCMPAGMGTLRAAHRGYRPGTFHAGGVNAILEGMNWLGLDYDEGPFYQTTGLTAIRRYCVGCCERAAPTTAIATREELEGLRAEQIARKDKPRYDGRYRDYQGPPVRGWSPRCGSKIR